MQRTARTLAAIWAIGLALDVLAISDGLTAFGLGLLIPGGGFAFTGQWVLLVLSLSAFTLSLVVFAVMSPYWVPPLVVIGLAAASALGAGGENVEAARVIVPLVLAAGLLALPVASRLKLGRLRREVDARNAFLAERSWAEPSSAVSTAGVTAMSDEDLAAMRRGFDLLLQPLDRFDGFLTLDQYREAAWRYQINFVAWYMAISRLTRTPAFSGYLAEAQRNGVEKMLDPRVWRYWRWEHLLGSLRWAPDPIPTDNIMLSGYFAAQVGSYETATGDLSFSEPGALSFDDGSNRYVYDYGSICERLRDNYVRGPLCMFPCEPNWVYPQCNAVGMTGLLLHDRVHGGELAASVWDEFTDALHQDLSRPDDRVVTIKSQPLRGLDPEHGGGRHERCGLRILVFAAGPRARGAPLGGGTLQPPTSPRGRRARSRRHRAPRPDRHRQLQPRLDGLRLRDRDGRRSRDGRRRDSSRPRRNRSSRSSPPSSTTAPATSTASLRWRRASPRSRG